jgi:chromosome segregation ATPase
MADDELDELYWVKPEDFTAVRTRLAKAANERGDAAGAKEISASRKPTTAAWVANRLAISHTQTKRRLTELRERLRAAHASLDGNRIRELTQEQRKLIDQLTRAAFEAAEVADPSAALRDDVTGTLQAAVADPDVTARLGRLVKAERWSGFGDFGADLSDPTTHDEQREDDDEAREQLESARAALEAAEQAKAEADEALSDRKTDVEEAQRCYEEAERALNDAGHARDEAQQACDNAADAVKEARAHLKRLGG